MVRWRHNVPAIEWERLARRMGRTAAALRAWVWRNRLPRWRRHPWTEPQLRRIRAQWQIGVAAGWSDRKIARAAAPTLRPHSVGSVYMQAYRLGLHRQPRPDGHGESPRGPPGSTPRHRVLRTEPRSTVSAAVRAVLPAPELPGITPKSLYYIYINCYKHYIHNNQHNHNNPNGYHVQLSNTLPFRQLL